MVIKRCWASVWGAGGTQPRARASREGPQEELGSRDQTLPFSSALPPVSVVLCLGCIYLGTAGATASQDSGEAQEQPTTSRPTAPGKQGFRSQHISYLMFPTS